MHKNLKRLQTLYISLLTLTLAGCSSADASGIQEVGVTAKIYDEDAAAASIAAADDSGDQTDGDDIADDQIDAQTNTTDGWESEEADDTQGDASREDGDQDSAGQTKAGDTFTVEGAYKVFYVKGAMAVVSEKDSKDDDSMEQADVSGGASIELKAEDKKEEKADEASDKTEAQQEKTGEEEAPAAVEVAENCWGIDVSSYQGVINWEKVASSGVSFAIVRAGYRSNDGVLHEDANARYNLQEASKHGIKLGAYFFSRAVSEEEAIQEAELVKDILSGYSITYPVAYNCEGYAKETSRQYGLSVEERSRFARTFLSTLSSAGYSPMFYASRNELSQGLWDTQGLSSVAKIWLAYYPSDSSDRDPGYSGAYAMWQFTSKGRVDGINGCVDVDRSSFNYSGSARRKGENAAPEVAPNMESGMDFTECKDRITALDEVNLRDRPSTAEGSVIVCTIRNGDVITRTGYSTTSGWSRVQVGEKTLYCVTRLLETVEE
ncbi:glycoside hydrolase family 25 protein [Butyrivibrio sp. MC2013]|uniref:glycoside hydrolase family 25 protein n=1 Tax=Butyrivibrio sp. MC2013 TaxID=1280686 RepID=UPI0003F88DA4|nr:glycoside hydrolase family 25 protein [Butyrivibrio sp. MC2013]